MDLEKFFDTVDHEVLMHRVARKVHDKRVLKLIGKYLRAGVMVNGRFEHTKSPSKPGESAGPMQRSSSLNDASEN